MHEPHAHLHLTNTQFLAGGTDFAEAMRNIGATEADTLDTMCLLIGLRLQIVQQ